MADPMAPNEKPSISQMRCEREREKEKKRGREGERERKGRTETTTRKGNMIKKITREKERREGKR